MANPPYLITGVDNMSMNTAPQNTPANSQSADFEFEYETECLTTKDIADCYSWRAEYCDDEANNTFNLYGDME